MRKLLDIDEVIHTPARLAILLFLLPRPNATFPEIKEALSLTSGNLSSHLKKLQSHRYVDISKAFVDLKPTTIVSITPEGRRAVNEYASFLRRQLEQTES
ncbi:MAG: ArsR family transcriptional regulator [Methanobacteriota archaeon]|nr:MAG: ArsR family transcriptional regulator [Euryarchaeota archaeon]